MSTQHTIEIQRALWVVGFLMCGWFAVPGALAGQTGQTGTLSGRILDEETREPVEGARIVLEGLERESISNELGRFALPAVPAGVVRVRAERIGYARSSGDVEIKVGQVTETVLYMSTEAVLLDPIVVTARRREVALPKVEGLERRYYSGWGRFVLADEIQKRNPTKLVQVLGETGLEVTGNGTSVLLSRANCAPAVYIDGVKVTHPEVTRGSPGSNSEYRVTPGQEAAQSLNLVHPSNVEAVEVYRSALETPGEFLDTYSNCGAVIVWTRRGTGLAEAGGATAEGRGGSGWEHGLVAVSLAALVWLAQSLIF